jgi:hypothetical protein
MQLDYFKDMLEFKINYCVNIHPVLNSRKGNNCVRALVFACWDLLSDLYYHVKPIKFQCAQCTQLYYSNLTNAGFAR